MSKLPNKKRIASKAARKPDPQAAQRPGKPVHEKPSAHIF